MSQYPENIPQIIPKYLLRSKFSTITPTPVPLGVTMKWWGVLPNTLKPEINEEVRVITGGGGSVNKNRTWLFWVQISEKLISGVIIPDLRVLQEFGRIRSIRGNSLGSPKNYYKMPLRVRRISLFPAPLHWGKIEMGQLEINNMIALLYIYIVKHHFHN